MESLKLNWMFRIDLGVKCGLNKNTFVGEREGRNEYTPEY